MRRSPTCSSSRARTSCVSSRGRRGWPSSSAPPRILELGPEDARQGGASDLALYSAAASQRIDAGLKVRAPPAGDPGQRLLGLPRGLHHPAGLPRAPAGRKAGGPARHSAARRPRAPPCDPPGNGGGREPAGGERRAPAGPARRDPRPPGRRPLRLGALRPLAVRGHPRVRRPADGLGAPAGRGHPRPSWLGAPDARGRGPPGAGRRAGGPHLPAVLRQRRPGRDARSVDPGGSRAAAGGAASRRDHRAGDPLRRAAHHRR